MVVAADLLPILPSIDGYQAKAQSQVAGPFQCGTLNGIKVFVHPMMDEGEFVVGVNGSDMMTSAAVYAPYMPVVPTQLLGMADGGMSQGFSTMYDFKILSKQPIGYTEDLNTAGTKYGRSATEDRPFSPLLVKGAVIA